MPVYFAPVPPAGLVVWEPSCFSGVTPRGPFGLPPCPMLPTRPAPALTHGYFTWRWPRSMGDFALRRNALAWAGLTRPRA